jgi:DNA-binding IclR family transcriptional regulator
MQSVAACAFDHSGRPCAAISVTWRQDHARMTKVDLVKAVRASAQKLTSALSGRAPDGWFGTV